MKRQRNRRTRLWCPTCGRGRLEEVSPADAALIHALKHTVQCDHCKDVGYQLLFHDLYREVPQDEEDDEGPPF